MGIKVMIPGALTTVQDMGRTGYQQFGIPVCGVMDQRAAAAANRLCRNEENAAVLEMTLFGGTYTFEEDTVIALTGADMEPKLNGETIPMYRPVFAAAGSALELSMAKKGCRIYLAVFGGIDVPLVMGSRSTDLKSGTGGFKGRKLAAGDIVPCRPFTGDMSAFEGLAEPEPIFPTKARIRVVGGPQEEAFTEEGLNTFYGSEYRLSDKCDRMGYRLEGERIGTVRGSDIISDGIAFGSIQVPSSGKPIILMADRQTAGGYTKIATVCSFDLPVLAQLKPGDTVTFEKISVEDAQRLLKQGAEQEVRNVQSRS